MGFVTGREKGGLRGFRDDGGREEIEAGRAQGGRPDRAGEHAWRASGRRSRRGSTRSSSTCCGCGMRTCRSSSGRPLVVAHDWGDAEGRTPLKLTEALDAFLEPPLDGVEIDLDIKLPGREEEIVDALRERGLIERAMVSTMELYSLGRIVALEPGLRRGWTYPKVTKDWTSKRWAKAPMLAALAAMRQRLPGLAAEKLPQMGVESMWVYHPLVSAGLARITKLAGVELIAWTVDDAAKMRAWSSAASTAWSPTTRASSPSSRPLFVDVAAHDQQGADDAEPERPSRPAPGRRRPDSTLLRRSRAGSRSPSRGSRRRRRRAAVRSAARSGRRRRARR